MDKEYHAYLSKFYYDPKAPASFAGPYKMWLYIRNNKDLPKGLSFKKVKKWYEFQVTHNVHVNPTKKFKREPIIVDHRGEMFDCDLIQISNLKRYNKGMAYILVCIDIFSRYGWALSLKTKGGQEVRSAMEKIFSEGLIPETIRSDRGSEFRSRPFTSLLKENNIYHMLAFSEIKAGYAERLNLTIQQKLYKYMYEHQTFKYVDILPDIIKSYNSTIHGTIGIAPKDVTEENSYALYERVYMPIVIKQNNSDIKYKFSVGDNVRISYEKMPFTRGYKQHFSEEIYEVAYRIPSHPPRYKLKDLNGEEIKGSFYEQQMQKVLRDPDIPFRISKVYKNKKKKIKGKIHFLVSWAGYPDKYNTYVSSSEIKAYSPRKK